MADCGRKVSDIEQAYAVGFSRGQEMERELKQRKSARAGAYRPQTRITVEHIGCLKLTELIATWDILHQRDTGEIGFCDLERALLLSGCTIVNDAPRQEEPTDE